MKATEFLIEKDMPSFNLTPTSQIDKKQEIISAVKKTKDEALIDKIYTALNHSTLLQRISSVLEKETDTKGYVDRIVKIIIDTPGTYEEKSNFIMGFPNGYVNVKLMLSGERVHFKDLLTSGIKDVPINFVKRVFTALKQVNFGSEKGPGEFALAVLSPHIHITGKGDLNIDGKVIEVKASGAGESAKASSGGGRLGNAGFLNHKDVPAILKKYYKHPLPRSITLTRLQDMTQKMKPESKRALGKELFSSIFGKGTDVSKIVKDFVAGNDLTASYTMINYEKYKSSHHFDALMLINFAIEELMYFSDASKLAASTYQPSIAIMTPNEGFAGRAILSSVTLRPDKVEKPTLPTVTLGKKISPQQEDAIWNYATDLVTNAGIAAADSQNMTEDIFRIMSDGLLKGRSTITIIKNVKSKYPILVKKKEQPITPAPSPAAPKVSAPIKPVLPMTAKDKAKAALAGTKKV